MSDQKLFYGVEQGTGKNEKNIFVTYNPRLKSVATKWMRVEHRKRFLVEGKNNYDTSALVVDKKDNACNTYLTRMYKLLLLINYKSYVSVLTGNESKNNEVKTRKLNRVKSNK